MKQKLSLVLAAVVLVACSETTSPPNAASDDQSSASFAEEPIPGQYIVVLRDQSSDSRLLSSLKISRVGGALLHVYSNALRGFAARLDDNAVAALRADP